MKAQELRIGNWLNMRDIPFQINSGFIHDLDYSNNNPERQDAIVFDDVEPIPLTEQWLIDFGFKKVIGFYIGIYPDANLELGYNNDKSYPQWYCFIRNILDDGNIDEFCIFRKDLRYVHQLQNLYFALTGEELQL